MAQRPEVERMRLVSGKVPARILLDPELWRWAKKKAVDLDVSASELTELGLRIVKAIVESGVLPSGLADLLDNDTRRRFEELLGKSG